VTTSPATLSVRNTYFSSAFWTCAFSLLLLSTSFLLVLYLLHEPTMTNELLVILGLVWCTLAPITLVMFRSTYIIRHDYQMAQLIDMYANLHESTRLAGFLNAYHQHQRRPTSFTLADCLSWVNKYVKVLDVVSATHYLTELENDGDILVDRPADGNLVITLTQQFHKQLNFANRHIRQ